MNRLEHDIWLEAVMSVCTDCTDGCGDMENCAKLAERIEERKAEITAKG